MPQHRPGERIGPWTLDELLGQGGNAEVWSARNESDRHVALKLLGTRRITHERYRRFVAETEFLRHSQYRGILPVIDTYLPEQPSRTDRPWIAMLIASPIRVALRSVNLIDVVRAIQEIAGTLAKLASDDISHRDVKPANLFELDGHYLIGDFGLVSFPGKEELTRPAREMGPHNFIAPEMVTDPDTADGRAADVYSLAKTLWVLSARRDYPPQGHLRTDTPALRLSSYVADRRARLIDRLLERATEHNPDSRMTMVAFRDALAGVVDPDLNPLNLADLADEVEGERREYEARFRESVDPANGLNLVVFPAALTKISEAAKDVGFGSGEIGDGEELLNLPGRRSLNDDGRLDRWTGGRAVEIRLPIRPLDGFVLSGLAVEIDDDGKAILVAGHAFIEAPRNDDRVRGGEFLWVDIREVDIDDNEAVEGAVQELAAGLTQNLRPAVRAAIAATIEGGPYRRRRRPQ